jgi:NitT/TauT family transport system ATP-binding protein
MSDGPTMVEVMNVSKAYNSGNGAVQALRPISFSVKTGEFVSIIGPSGCGKSTLIKIIGDLVDPTGGSVRVGGHTTRQARQQGMFSFVFQNPVLLPWRRVIENVHLPLEILGRQSRNPAQLLEMVGLSGFEARYPKELSGGMQQRVALARALTFDPQVLLMDEPFGAVDELTRGSLNRQLLEIWQKIRVTVLLITHSISEAVFLSDRVIVLSPRPAIVREILEVPFPRPRENGLQDSDRFQEVVKFLREKLE